MTEFGQDGELSEQHAPLSSSHHHIMTIDQEDYAPRKPDDFWSCLPIAKPLQDKDAYRLSSILVGSMKIDSCHQLGCEFSELPHC